MAICAVRGGCPSDYVSVSIATLSVIMLLVVAGMPYLIHKIPRPKGSGFWLVAIQVFASFNFLSSIVMALGFLRYRRSQWWSSCYIWADEFPSTGILLCVDFTTTRLTHDREEKGPPRPQHDGSGPGHSGQRVFSTTRINALDRDPNEPLDSLLTNRRFRQSFMEFADSCLAGESVRFYEEVQQLDKIPIGDLVRRIYMARHVYYSRCVDGGEHISSLQNLVNDYWSSTFFMKLQDEERMRSIDHDAEQSSWNFPHRLSSVHCTDDPFHQEHSPSKLSSSSHELELH